MTITQIELSKLERSPLNVRKTASRAALDELKASILAHGLMQNLIVTEAEGGSYHVIAGARRLAALHELQAEGKLTDDFAAPCQIVTEEHALEMSLAENTVRAAMHPADEFEAFAALADEGQTAEQIAERFGTTEKRVLQRLKLGRVAPELLAEYRAGEIKLETLEAFTVTDDRKRQLDLYRGLRGWQKDSAHHIRSALTEQMVEGDSKLAKFVGLEAYQAAGGRVKADLFEDTAYLENMALLHSLAGDMLQAEAEKLRADGWGWVEVDFDRDYSAISRHSRIHPTALDAPADLAAEKEAIEAEGEAIEKEWDEADDDDEALLDAIREKRRDAESRLEAVEEKLESFVDFDPEQKKLAGCFVSISYGGKLDIDKGLVKPADKKTVAKAQADGSEPEEAASEKPAMSQSLIDDLSRYRNQVARVAIAENPAIAFDLLVFKAARRALGNGYGFDGADVRFDDHPATPTIAGDTAAAERLEEIKDALPVAWLKEKTEPQQFAAFQQLPDADKHRLLAYCTALTLNPKLAPAEGMQKTAYDTALAQTGVDVASYWRPTAENFLKRLKIVQLIEAGSDIMGEQWGRERNGYKKSRVVEELSKLLDTPDQWKGLTPEQTERLKNWLPDRMAFGTAPAEQPEAKAKKGKKAA